MAALEDVVDCWTPDRFRAALRNPREAVILARWLIRSGRLPEYRLAAEFEARKREEEWVAGATAPEAP